METEELEFEIDATSFKELNVESAISFMELLDSDWATTGLPEVDENIACTYLKVLRRVHKELSHWDSSL